MKTNYILLLFWIIILNPLFAQHTGINYYNGSYHFDTLHVDAAGYVKNTKGCEIYFSGWNSGAMSTGSADGITNADSNRLEQKKLLMQYNVIRMELNTRWWVNNVTCPAYNNQLFQDRFIKNIAKAKSLGLYVIIDFFLNNSDNPTGTKGYYGSQTLGECNFITNHDTTELQQNNFYAIQAIGDLAKLYGNEPAVIFDVWNEPGSYIWDVIVPATEKRFLSRMNHRIDTLRKYAPNSMAIVFAGSNFGNFMTDSLNYPFYKQKNILIDFHYQNFLSQDTINFIRAHGKGIIECEFGSTGNGFPLGSVKTIDKFAKKNHIGLLNYHEDSIFTYTPLALTNPYGQVFAAGYDSLFADSTICIPTNIYEQTGLQTFKIYPNPTSGIFNLKMGQFENLKMKELKVFNVFGQCIYQLTNLQINSSSNLQIDLSSDPNGMYFIYIKTEQGVMNKKLIVNH